MTGWQKTVLVLSIVAIICGAWLYRYDLEVGGGGGDRPALGYMLDRWTGKTYLLGPSFVRELQPQGRSVDWRSFVPLDEEK